MGARPIATLDSIRFGDLSNFKTKYLVNGVVKGIGHYGNCIGIPNIGGECEFDPKEAINAVETSGIVFLDEIDKVCAKTDARGGDVSREGVQRDLLPLIEGTTVSTKHGSVKTDHILFIASGAFHIAKPSDLLPELQGRLPSRVELRALTEKDFVRILTETDNALTRQYSALMATENVDVTFTKDGIAALAKIAAEVNESIENIGARRLHTIIERVFEEISPLTSFGFVTFD